VCVCVCVFVCMCVCVCVSVCVSVSVFVDGGQPTLYLTCEGWLKLCSRSQNIGQRRIPPQHLSIRAHVHLYPFLTPPAGTPTNQLQSFRACTYIPNLNTSLPAHPYPFLNPTCRSTHKVAAVSFQACTYSPPSRHLSFPYTHTHSSPTPTPA
jgi:hypothetical protein